MRVHPPVKALNAAFTVEYGPLTCHQPCPARVDLKLHKVVMIYLRAIFTEYKPKKLILSWK
jgi:hypothetical protein